MGEIGSVLAAEAFMREKSMHFRVNVPEQLGLEVPPDFTPEEDLLKACAQPGGVSRPLQFSSEQDSRSDF